MLVFSEFSRTPMINTRDGRDHHLTSSCLVAGPGIKGNTVFGASSNTGMTTQKWNFATGALDPTAGALIRPGGRARDAARLDGAVVLPPLESDARASSARSRR